MNRPFGVIALAAVLLSACTELQELTPDDGRIADDDRAVVTADRAMVAALPDEKPPVPRRKPEAEEDAGSNVEETEPEAEAVVDPEVLVGLSFVETEKILGEPALLIEEPPAKIWAYYASGCVLHIFFYPKVGGTDFRVLTYKAKGGGDETEKSFDFAERCVAELIADVRAGRGAGDVNVTTPDSVTMTETGSN